MCVWLSTIVWVGVWVWGCACLRLYLVYVALGIYLPTVRHSQPNWENFVTPRRKKRKNRVYIYFGELLGGSFVKRTGFDDNSIELGTSVAFFSTVSP